MSPATIDLRLTLPLAHFTLEVEIQSSARALGVFGASGSGKTSLLEAVAGWRRSARGFLRVGDRVLLDDTRGIDVPVRARDIGYVPQDALLFPHLDVERNLRAHARPARTAGGRGTPASSSDDPELVFAHAVHVLGLQHLLARDVRSLSGGERQRVALGRALCSRPRLLLLDEPLGALDWNLRRRILPWLLRLRDAVDVPMLFVSHDPTEVQALCDEVVVLDAGRVTARGPTSSTLRAELRPGERYENLLHGRVLALASGSAEIEIEPGVSLRVVRDGRGDALDRDQRVTVVLDADDVLVAVQPPVGLSARNVLRATLVSLRASPVGAVHADLRLAGASAAAGSPLSVSLTEEAVRELGLAPGMQVYAVFKSSSCRVLAANETRA